MSDSCAAFGNRIRNTSKCVALRYHTLVDVGREKKYAAPSIMAPATQLTFLATFGPERGGLDLARAADARIAITLSRDLIAVERTCQH